MGQITGQHWPGLTKAALQPQRRVHGFGDAPRVAADAMSRLTGDPVHG